ncbi:Hypothetical protein ACI5QL_03026 [Bacillus velezensis]|uniref:Uncharacterized protein n=1 Tax=Bacillus amyloliquefaciens (strain Y2) TaxID=1155777 RepID=I2C920_BACAY|nr:hypothetical protein MUS_3260 [Bacillus velezensis YAU B9601-Y2]
MSALSLLKALEWLCSQKRFMSVFGISYVLIFTGHQLS